MQPLLRYPGCIFCIYSHSFLTNVIIQDYIPICTFFLKVHSGDPQKLFLQIKKNVPRHIRAPRAVACDNLHLRASAHLRHAVPFSLKMGRKKASGGNHWLSSGKGIMSLMGYSKNYIMYWGVFTVYIIPWGKRKVCTNFTKFGTLFCLHYIPLFSVSRFSVVKSASNSSLCTFSFSRRRLAHLCRTSSCSRIIFFARS